MEYTKIIARDLGVDIEERHLVDAVSEDYGLPRQGAIEMISQHYHSIKPKDL